MADKLVHRTALVLYGSETGNAQDFAEELSRLAQKIHFSCEVLPLDAVQPGDLPTNARLFWKHLLRKRLPATFLLNTTFALFGLGDTSYPQYNWAALKLNKRLLQLAAKELIPRGEGDEQHPEGYDAAFIPWAKNLRAQLLEKYPLASQQTPIPDDVLLHPPWLLSAVNNQGDSRDGRSESPKAQSFASKQARTDQNDVFDVFVEQNSRITSQDHFQDVRHFVFSTQNHMQYNPGDVLTVYPQNKDEDVQQLVSIMKWDTDAETLIEYGANSLFVGSKRPPKPSVLSPHVSSDLLTLRKFLAFELDLNAIPRRSFFSLIAHFTEDEFQKERLLEFANPELVDELFDYTTRPRRSILEVLQEFDTLKIPWQWAAAVLPRLRGRQFSIASGGSLKTQSQSSINDKNSQQTKTKFELLVAIVKYRTVIKKIRRGVCTRYLEGLAIGTRLPVTIQKGTLGAQSADLVKPAIMIGPGTGLAPIRALIWERWAWQQNMKLQVSSSCQTFEKVAPSILFFGCRNRRADYFFEHEWKSLQELGMPLEVFVAFSRDQQRKVYVQDLISQQYDLLYKCICQQDGLVFLCGSSGKMPQAVRGALVDVIHKGGGVDLEEAEKELKRLEKLGRYKQETW